MSLSGAVLFFIWIADAVSEGETGPASTNGRWGSSAGVGRTIPQFRSGPAWLSEMGLGMPRRVGGAGFLFLLTLIVAGFVASADGRRPDSRRRIDGRGTVVSLVSEILFDRPRPQLFPTCRSSTPVRSRAGTR